MLATSFFGYLTFDRYRYCSISQQIEYHILVQYVHHSWEMKEQFRRINISFHLNKIDKLYKLQHHFWWVSDGSLGFPYSTVLKLS